ncbi:LamG domain-containing protein [Nocardioides sp. GCM10027113]|uniref:LamG domain-containing protein n=1 Tax=unclassified Nocardioides TaxID=2615069 RepID=UPI00362409A2
MPSIRSLAVASATALALAATASPAAAQVIGDYHLDDNAPGSPRPLVDSGPLGMHGSVGDKVVKDVDLGGGQTGYYFPGPAWGYDPERMATAPEDDRFDPETEPYAVTIRFRTHHGHPNIVQKGQSGQTGGFWKFVLKNGWPRCHYRDRTGRTSATGFVRQGNEYKVTDGKWYTVRCERMADRTRITLNYGTPDAVSRQNRKSTGDIDNRSPLMLGGKLFCKKQGVGCDYFQGWIDWVMIEKGDDIPTTLYPDRVY